MFHIHRVIVCGICWGLTDGLRTESLIVAGPGWTH